MSWFTALWPIAAATAILVVPGYAVARVLGLRGLWAWGLAAPASMSVLVLASLWAPVVKMRWSLLPVLITALVVLMLAIAVRMSARPPAERVAPRPTRYATLIGLGVAALLLATQLVLIIGDPRNISQSFDNVFHLNAVRYIMDTGSASSLTVGKMTSPGASTAFYPAGWHALVALVTQSTGTTIMIASNAVAMVVATVVWPASALLLTRVVAGPHPVVMASAGVVSAVVPAFPILMIDYGVLYPYFLAVSILPAALAATIALLHLCRTHVRIPRSILVVVVLGVLPGLIISHPGAFVAWIALSLVAGSVAYGKFLAGRPPRRAFVGVSVCFVVVLIIAAIAWKYLKPPLEARGWPVEQSVGQAIGQAITLSPTYGYVCWLIVPLLGLGIGVLARRRRAEDLVPLLLYVSVIALYVVCSAMVWPDLRDRLTGAWYNNSPRLAALLPMVAVPIAALGSNAAVAWVRRTVGRHGSARRGLAVCVVVAGVALIAAQAYTVQHALRVVSKVYAYSDESHLISEDELTLLDRLAKEVPSRSVIAGSPWTGAGLAYAFDDRRVTMPHMLMGLTGDEQLIMDHLSSATPGSSVCAAIQRTGTGFVLDFGQQEIHGAEHVYPGLVGLATSDAVKLVDSQGSARLYKVTACAR
ncbi:DUF6541 family protein [Microbacterium sp. 22242]|uniref:DUF6541 family protein n=1 Tax=Microbacterium sp. 22242 TaxID=3453896 RepID=UPI003F8525C4